LRVVRDMRGEEVVRELVRLLGVKNLRPSGLRIVRSNSKTSAVARIWGVSKALQAGLGIGPTYVIELIEPEFSSMPCHERLRTLLHELAHIPKTFSGYVRPHNRWFRQELNAWLRRLNSLPENEMNRLCWELDEGWRKTLSDIKDMQR